MTLFEFADLAPDPAPDPVFELARDRGRTDMHRPSAPEFDPNGYEFRGAFDLRPEPGPYAVFEARRRIEHVNALLAEGYHFIGVHGMGNCDHCGAYVRYTALMAHTATKGLIWIGETCLGNRFESGLSAEEFHRLRKEARLNRERATKDEKLAKVLAEMPADLRAAYDWAGSRPARITGGCSWDGREFKHEGADYEDLTFEERRLRNDKGWNLADDVASNVRRYLEPLSPGRANLLLKLHREHIEREAKRAAEAEARVAKVAAGTVIDCPEGRVTVTGKILTVKVEDDPYSEFEPRTRMLVEDDRGFRVWGTMPAAICDCERGDRVTFAAKVTPKDGDPSFGIYSRPTKARKLETE